MFLYGFFFMQVLWTSWCRLVVHDTDWIRKEPRRRIRERLTDLIRDNFNWRCTGCCDLSVVHVINDEAQYIRHQDTDSRFGNKFVFSRVFMHGYRCLDSLLQSYCMVLLSFYVSKETFEHFRECGSRCHVHDMFSFSAFIADILLSATSTVYTLSPLLFHAYSTLDIVTSHESHGTIFLLTGKISFTSFYINEIPNRTGPARFWTLSNKTRTHSSSIHTWTVTVPTTSTFRLVAHRSHFSADPCWALLFWLDAVLTW